MCNEFGRTFRYFEKGFGQTKLSLDHAHTLYRCTVDIRRILVVGYEGDTTFYVRMLYNLEHAMALHRYQEAQWLTKLALVDAQLLYKDGPIGLPPHPSAQ